MCLVPLLTLYVTHAFLFLHMQQDCWTSCSLAITFNTPPQKLFNPELTSTLATFPIGVGNVTPFRTSLNNKIFFYKERLYNILYCFGYARTCYLKQKQNNTIHSFYTCSGSSGGCWWFLGSLWHWCPNFSFTTIFPLLAYSSSFPFL